MKKTILLRHNSGWLIVYDGGYPSGNYCVFKGISWDVTQSLPSKGVAYHGSLENALKDVYDQILIENIVGNKEYAASLENLKAAIEKTHEDFHKLLQPNTTLIQKKMITT